MKLIKNEQTEKNRHAAVGRVGADGSSCLCGGGGVSYSGGVVFEIRAQRLPFGHCRYVIRTVTGFVGGNGCVFGGNGYD